MNVRRNMAFSLNLRRSPASLISERVQRRVAEARASAASSSACPSSCRAASASASPWAAPSCATRKVFLFDEPLSNLDAKLRSTMRTEIKALHQSLKTTAIYVTHDQVEAMTMANRIVVMNDGVIQQVGAPLELYDRPANIFVAGFIGSPTMNFFDAVIENGSARLAEGSVLALPSSVVVGEGHQIALGIRPEHLHFASAGIPARVVVVEPLGMSTQVTLDAVQERVTLLTLARPQLSPGEDRTITAKTEDLHVFDRESGLRLN